MGNIYRIGVNLSKETSQSFHTGSLPNDFSAFSTRLTKENADEIIRTYDIIIDGCDNFATRYLINDICVKWGKVYVYGAIRAFEGQVSVFNYRGGPDYRHFFPDEADIQLLALGL